MEWTLVVGYLAAIIGAFYVLPQTVHVIRVGSSAGLSPLTWQLQVGASTGWTVHGFLTGQPNVGRATSSSCAARRSSSS